MALIDYIFVFIVVLLIVCCLAIESDSIRRNLRQLGVLMIVLCGALCYLLVTAESSDSYFFSDFVGNKGQSSTTRRQADGKGGNGKGADPVAGKDPTGPGDGWGKDAAPANIELVAGQPPAPEDDASGGSAGGSMSKRDQQGGAGDSADGQGEQGTVTVTGQQAGGEAGTATNATTDVLADCAVCPSLVHVPAGALVIGSPPREKGRFLHESPRRRITIRRPFYIGRFEVTVDQFAAFVDDIGYRPSVGCVADHNRSPFVTFRRPGFPQTGAHPVVCVSWDDAKAYARWLSARTKLKYRLPTEAEWELAARAGTREAFGQSGVLDPKTVNFSAVAGGTMPVGSHPPNGLGMFDVAGNVWELVEDCWQPSLATVPEDGAARPLAPDMPCVLRTMRGGAWYNSERHVRSAARWANPASVGGNGIGFRVVREIEAAAAVAPIAPPPVPEQKPAAVLQAPAIQPQQKSPPASVKNAPQKKASSRRRRKRE